MKIKQILMMLLCLIIISCRDNEESGTTTTDSTGQTQQSTVSADDPIVESVSSSLDYKIIEISEHSGAIDLTVSTDSARDVYFVFTNTNKLSSVSSPNITKNAKSVATMGGGETVGKEEVEISGVTRIDNPTAKEFRENPFIGSPKLSSSKSISIPERTESYSVNDSLTFYADTSSTNDNGTDEVDATLRKKVTVGDVNLYVWVEDSSYGSGTGKVNSSMIEAMADKFLISGDDNDIYDWVTNIVGLPWGSYDTSQLSYLIDPTSDIHILLADLDGDGVPTSGESRVYGYYYALDNYVKDTSSEYWQLEYTNEKIMFYIDAPLLSDKEGDSWEITDTSPKEIVSTLAHEFQHMINFYQKNVKNGNVDGSETWLNELASMAVEDLVASKILADGPRGVTYDDATAGSSSNTLGRLPLYNYYNEIPLTSWGSGSDVLKSYAINYAFGAYLTRNFGGADFLKTLVQNDEINYQAVTDALAETGYSSYDFDTVLNKFGTANLLSNFTDAPTNMELNSGTWFSSTLNGEEYSLGSINLYNYTYNSSQGPYVYSSLPSRFYATSNTYYKAGNDISGSERYVIDNIDDDIKVSIVIK